MSFWKWWTIFVLTCTGAAFAEVNLNISHYLINVDTTKISMLIIGIFVACNLVMSYYAFKIQFYKQQFAEQYFRPLWFSSDQVLTLGMIGTLVGFLMVLMQAFGNIDTSSTEQLKSVLTDIATGMGVAIITTLTGLIVSGILKLQIMLLEIDNETI